MRVAVVRFPGSNCDDDVKHVLDRVIPNGVAKMVWHKDAGLGDCDAVMVPGGFSYGDYLRSGAMAAHSSIMSAVKEFVDKGGPVLGICNGFQILCEAGLLDGALLRNQSLRFECRDVHLVVEGRPTPFTFAIPAGRVLRMPIAHAEGRYFHDQVERLEREGRVVFRYVDAGGGTGEDSNPNGSLHSIAGITNAAGNVVGLMPHPERAAEPILAASSTGTGADGRFLFDSLAMHLQGKKARVK